ncbi:ShlB/FhaC/HecB family hemolysin secretion/activation protein [Oceanicoccus sp. KOV_DT_Chl]|uniref:ShlB/FhaC/HecB family hemolysin secretion/activation protein n=1 Tax=Oceanicoccus sp. KOV_DT_Chl TaxID=1904639 RepID=UPI00135CB2E4|nr:POTRA domain-containing protein [Oceanicoccus sp. KOV_DT_Chl]
MKVKAIAKFFNVVRPWCLAVFFLFVVSTAQALTFLDILEFSVEGNTLLEKSVVERAVAPFLGYTRKVDDVDNAARALQSVYRNKGYPTVFVEVPEQDVVNGVIKLKVVEARVRRVTVDGAQYFSIKEIRGKMPSVAEGNVLHLPSLQQDQQQVNMANADLVVVPVIKPGPVANTIDVDLSVEDSLPVHGGIELTNYHSAGTTSERLAADISYRNLWQQHHDMSLQMQISPQNRDEVQVIAASYSLPMNELGAKLSFIAIDSDSEVASLDGINVLGDGSIFTLRYSHPFVLQPTALHSFSIAIDYKDFIETIDTGTGSTLETPIDYLSWSGGYDMFTRDDFIKDILSLNFVLGIRGVVNSEEEFGEKRSQALSNFLLWKFDWQRSYLFTDGWEVSHQIRAQLADSALVSNEQFGAGGINTVRGYYESQIQGDYGAVFNLELKTPDLLQESTWFEATRVGVFYDSAYARLKSPLPDQDDEFIISSYGLSLRTQLFNALKIKVDSGVAIKAEGDVEKNNAMTRASIRLIF